MEKFVIIDGNSLINRAFYALPMLANFEGEISNAVFGFTNILVKAINEIKPKYMCVAFDFGKKTFRNQMFENYKGTRKPTPTELVSQFPILKTMLKAMNIKFIELEGVEADDIIGSITRLYDTENIVITGDRDAFQLINNNTFVMFTKKGISETVLYDEKQLMLDFGVTPQQIIDLKALMGDASDNIPGISGVGEKTALSLIQQYGNLDNIYNNINQISGKLKEKIENGKEIAYLSKQLATIKLDVPINFNLDYFTYDYPFSNEVKQLFERYQFNSLLKRKELFSDENIEVNIEKEIELIEVNNKQTLIKAVENLINKKQIAVVLTDNKLCLFDKTCEYIINFETDLLTEGLEIEDTLKNLEAIFLSNNIEKVVFDYKGILHKLNKYDITLNNVVFDIVIARYLINNNAKPNIAIEEMIAEQGLNKRFLAYSVYLMKENFSKKLNELDLENLFYNVEMPLSSVLFDMEKSGFKIDLNELDLLDKKYSEQIFNLTKQIYDVCGIEFNINSPKQLSDVLFNKLGIKAYNNKKNSTGIEVLQDIVNAHPVVPLIIEYRKITKLYTTYIKAFGQIVNPKTNKIHTVFNQTNTATGRLSSNEPNLQNIPIRSEEGKSFRKIFVPSFEDGYIVTADYSQIELRLLASFSEDQKLINAFNSGEDIHAQTASEIFGVPLNQVSPAQRRDAKAINFGIIYGISDYGLSQNINVSREVAANYIKKYFEKYPKVKEYMNKNIEFCRQNGYVKTLLGRIRYINEINSSNYNLRQFGERAAMNMPLQGSASDIIKLAMVNVFNEFNKCHLKSKLILQIHDELIIDCASDELEIVKTILRNCMENAVNLKVKLDVNIEVGKNWFEAK